MKLSLEDVKRVARLARIDLSVAESIRFKNELSEIIDFNAKKLAQIKRRVPIIQTLSDSLGQSDQPRPSLSVEDVLANAPEQEDSFFVVPKVLDEP
jgi:aspartyl-tRNA(Asn)/glutamyl-tRNA(Gln) amidotransferase subunit C